MADRFRWSIGRGMILIAALAGLIASFGVKAGVGILVASLIVTSPVAFARPGRRYEALSWIVAGFPFLFALSLVATWSAAWAVLDRLPRTVGRSVDLAIVLAIESMVIQFVSPLACLVLATLRGIDRLDADSPPEARILKAILQPALWVVGYIFWSLLGPFSRWFTG